MARSELRLGAGERVNLAGGVSLIPGSDGQLVYIAPKVTVFDSETTSVAAGVIASTFLGNDMDDVPTFGMAYGVAPLGYFAMESLLASIYAEPVSIGPSAFILSFSFVLGTAVLTISTQVRKFRDANPVEVLRND